MLKNIMQPTKSGVGIEKRPEMTHPEIYEKISHALWEGARGQNNVYEFYSVTIDELVSRKIITRTEAELIRNEIPGVGGVSFDEDNTYFRDKNGNLLLTVSDCFGSISTKKCMRIKEDRRGITADPEAIEFLDDKQGEDDDAIEFLDDDDKKKKKDGDDDIVFLEDLEGPEDKVELEELGDPEGDKNKKKKTPSKGDDEIVIFDDIPDGPRVVNGRRVERIKGVDLYVINKDPLDYGARPHIVLDVDAMSDPKRNRLEIEPFKNQAPYLKVYNALQDVARTTNNRPRIVSMKIGELVRDGILTKEEAGVIRKELPGVFEVKLISDPNELSLNCFRDNVGKKICDVSITHNSKDEGLVKRTHDAQMTGNFPRTIPGDVIGIIRVLPEKTDAIRWSEQDSPPGKPGLKIMEQTQPAKVSEDDGGLGDIWGAPPAKTTKKPVGSGSGAKELLDRIFPEPSRPAVRTGGDRVSQLLNIFPHEEERIHRVMNEVDEALMGKNLLEPVHELLYSMRLRNALQERNDEKIIETNIALNYVKILKREAEKKELEQKNQIEYEHGMRR